MPTFAEPSFFFKFIFDECRAVMSVESGAVEFRVAVQPAHWMVSLKNLTASSVSSVVLRGMLRVSRSVIRRRNNPSLCVDCLSVEERHVF
jgi:hypothetical protein